MAHAIIPRVVLLFWETHMEQLPLFYSMLLFHVLFNYFGKCIWNNYLYFIRLKKEREYTQWRSYSVSLGWAAG
jgi:hypothetical protein